MYLKLSILNKVKDTECIFSLPPPVLISLSAPLSPSSTVSSFLLYLSLSLCFWLFPLLSYSVIASFCFPLSTLSLHKSVTSFFPSYLNFSLFQLSIAPSPPLSLVLQYSPQFFYYVPPAIKYVIMLLPRKSRK